MNGLPEAIARVPPVASTSGEINAEQSTTFAAGVAHAAVEIPGPAAGGLTPGLGGRWMTFVWLPTVADQLIRLRWGDSNVTCAATSRAFMAGVEYDYWINAQYTHFSGLSAGGGELSWHVSNK